MSLIINCEKCSKRMGSLEPYKVRDNKYLCVKCFDALEKEQKAIQDIYTNTPDECIPWAFGILKAPDFPYDGILTGIVTSESDSYKIKNTKYLCTDPAGEVIKYKSTFTSDQWEALNKAYNNIINKPTWTLPIIQCSDRGKLEIVDLTSNVIPAPSVNNTITFQNSLGQELSTGTLSSVDFSQAGKITIIANIVVMFDLTSIAKISFTLDNMFSAYSVKLVSNIITTDTHYSFLVQLEFDIV